MALFLSMTIAVCGVGVMTAGVPKIQHDNMNDEAIGGSLALLLGLKLQTMIFNYSCSNDSK